MKASRIGVGVLLMAAVMSTGCEVREHDYYGRRPYYRHDAVVVAVGPTPPPPQVVYAPAPPPPQVVYTPAPPPPQPQQVQVFAPAPPPPQPVMVQQPPPPDQVTYDVQGAPPQAIVEVQPPAPSVDVVWLPGYWVVQGRGWVWVRGRYDHPPHRGAVWVGGGWDGRGRNYHFHQGYWR